MTRLALGDRVTVPFVLGCAMCEYCLRGDAQVCPDQLRPGFSLPGSFADRVAVPRADANVVRLPDEVGMAAAASLGCRFATAYRAVVTHGRTAQGQWVAVHGCGGVGLRADGRQGAGRARRRDRRTGRGARGRVGAGCRRHAGPSDPRALAGDSASPTADRTSASTRSAMPRSWPHRWRLRRPPRPGRTARGRPPPHPAAHGPRGRPRARRTGLPRHACGRTPRLLELVAAASLAGQAVGLGTQASPWLPWTVPRSRASPSSSREPRRPACGPRSACRE